MNRHFSLLLSIFILVAMSSCKEKVHKALISTDYGDITVILYNSTPKHRDNFVKLVEDGYYNDLLFHRVINQFMIQGGDPDSKNAPAGMQLGTGGPGYEIDPEIGAPHFRGALAAARTPNAEKRSSGSQFYIVTGRVQNDNELKVYEERRKVKYNDVQRKIYMEEGGYPALDMEYTVFGEVVAGMDVVEKISQLPKDSRDRPAQDVKMKIKMLN
jgi:peptidyl-prolyl cis-trans isomerase B (cyclophilin B)